MNGAYLLYSKYTIIYNHYNQPNIHFGTWLDKGVQRCWEPYTVQACILNFQPKKDPHLQTEQQTKNPSGVYNHMLL